MCVCERERDIGLMITAMTHKCGLLSDRERENDGQTKEAEQMDKSEINKRRNVQTVCVCVCVRACNVNTFT